MNKNIYKYFSPDILSIAFKKDNYCGLKCSYPKDYNDPYELFLTIDFNQSPELLAFYKESIGSIPQYPTTCFSNSPIITPMWAHYANDLKGFIIEFDEDKIKEHFENANIENVSYQDEANPRILEMMKYAQGTGKPRHTYMFWNAITHAAYFTKNLCWNYEKERRLVTKDTNDIVNVNGHMIMYIPNNCIKSIILGSRIEKELKDTAIQLAEKLSCNYFDMKIGRSNSIPYFINKNKETYIFSNEQLTKIDSYCEDCKEPIKDNENLCPWCSINDTHIEDAIYRNPMNILGEAGMLESYLNLMNGVGKKNS